MTTAPLPRKHGYKLRTRFYVWLRTKGFKIAQEIRPDGSTLSYEILARKYELGRVADIGLVLHLLRTHETALERGDWTGVEKELFEKHCPNYLELPSVRRALYQLNDPRVTSAPPPPKKRPLKKKSRRHGKGSGGGVPADVTTSPAPAQDTLTESPRSIPTTGPSISLHTTTSTPSDPLLKEQSL